MIHVNLQERHTTPLSLAPLNIKEPSKTLVGIYKLPDGVETVSNEDIAKDTSVGSFYTRPYTLSNDRRATFEVKTAQGDKVTLTYERSEFRNDYLRFEGGYVPGLPIINNSKDTFSMTVEGENIPDNTDPRTGPVVSKLSELGKITKEIFKDVSKSTKNDAISDTLKILEQDFSGLIEELMEMLEDPDRVKNYFDSWA